MCSCGRFGHKQKENLCHKFEGTFKIRIYPGIEHGMMRAYHYNSGRIATPKHVSFDDRHLFFLRKLMGYPCVVNQRDESTEETKAPENMNIFVHTDENKTCKIREHDISDESSTIKDRLN